MSEEKKTPVFIENLAVLTTPEGFQKYLLGYKKNGKPRAVYDIVKDYAEPGKKKSKKKKKGKKEKIDVYDIYMAPSYKKKKKKKKEKYWHI